METSFYTLGLGISYRSGSWQEVTFNMKLSVFQVQLFQIAFCWENWGGLGQINCVEPLA